MRTPLRAMAMAGSALVLAAMLVPALPAAEAQVSPPWETVELQPLEGDDITYVRDINHAGFSVGASGGPVGTPVRWDADGEPTELPVPEGCMGTVMDINGPGQMLGFANCTGGVVGVGLRWTPAGQLTVLPAGTPNVALNDGGYVVGYVNVAGSTEPAIQWPGGGQIVVLDDGGAPHSNVVDMTEYGFVAGNVHLGPQGPDPWLASGWIGPYAFPLSFVPDARSVAVSEPGYVLLDVPQGSDHRGVLVGPGGRVVELDSSGTSDEMIDINDRNIVLGSRTQGAVNPILFGALYGTNAVVPLADLASAEDAETWHHYAFPVALNDDAWVVGIDDSTRSWLLRPPTS